jgi:hypothetical protein
MEAHRMKFLTERTNSSRTALQKHDAVALLSGTLDPPVGKKPEEVTMFVV